MNSDKGDPRIREKDLVEIVIRGAPNTGKTTLARIIEDELREAGWERVIVEDAPPSPSEKPPFQERLKRNMQRQIAIRVEVLK